MNASYDNVPIKVVLSTFETNELIRTLEPMLYSYIYISETCGNDIFDRVWRERISELSTAGSISVNDIISQLWEPTVSKCTELLFTLQKRTMILSVVDQYFQQYVNNKEAAVDNMVKLLRGLRYCVDTFGEPEMEEGMIKDAIDVMQQYWSLRTYSNAAKICLELKEKLQLTGSFEIVNVLASQVC